MKKRNHSRPITLGDACMHYSGRNTILASEPHNNEAHKAALKYQSDFEEKVEHLNDRQIKTIIERCLNSGVISTFDRLYVARISKKHHLKFYEKAELSRIYINTKIKS